MGLNTGCKNDKKLHECMFIIAKNIVYYKAKKILPHYLARCYVVSYGLINYKVITTLVIGPF